MGIPLAFGAEALLSVGISVVMTACVLFSLALIIIEIAQNDARTLTHALRKVALLRIGNPLIWAPALGVSISIGDIHLPAPVERSIDLWARIASPCALLIFDMFIGVHSAPSAESKTIR